VVAAIAWRARVSLPILGVLLMAYGYGLELLQEFIPTRNFRTTDLISNGLGILLAPCWVYLCDSLFGESARLSRPARRRPRALATRNGKRPGMQSSGS
jgi:VanZ family protein